MRLSDGSNSQDVSSFVEAFEQLFTDTGLWDSLLLGKTGLGEEAENHLKSLDVLLRKVDARQALARDGYDLTVWITQEEAEAALPPEEKTTGTSQPPPTVRNPTRAVLIFVNKESKKRRSVFLENNGKSLIVTIQKPKMD